MVVLFILVSCLLNTTQREDNAPCYMFSIRSVVVLIDSFEIETQVEFMIRHKQSHFGDDAHTRGRLKRSAATIRLQRSIATKTRRF